MVLSEYNDRPWGFAMDRMHVFENFAIGGADFDDHHIGIDFDHVAVQIRARAEARDDAMTGRG